MNTTISQLADTLGVSRQFVWQTVRKIIPEDERTFLGNKTLCVLDDAQVRLITERIEGNRRASAAS